MKIQPLADRILVSPVKSAEVSPGGIMIPEPAKAKPQTGVVVAVGPGRTLDDGTTLIPDVAVGETILYGQYGGTEVTLDGETFLMMASGDVLGVMESL